VVSGMQAQPALQGKRMSLQDDAAKEIDRLAKGAGDGQSHVGVSADKGAVVVEAEIELGKNVSAVGWFKQTWDKGRAWAAGLGIGWGGKK